MTTKPNVADSQLDWAFVCHLDYGGSGTAVRVEHSAGQARVRPAASAPESGLARARKPIFLGFDTTADQVTLLDPAAKVIERHSALPSDAIPAYAYLDPDGSHIWFMNDGDEDTGNDTLNCGNEGSSVTIIANGGHAAGEAPPQLRKVLCVGRGHHVTAFCAPSDTAPAVPLRAFVSNLQDGTISVIGHDPDNTGTYLTVLDTINLCDPSRENGENPMIPNNAFPHGMEYSPTTGKVYCLSNGYGTIAVIDPITNKLERTIELKKSSNLLLSRDGRFLVGKGVDRKSDPNHVIGVLTVVDAITGAIAQTTELPDIYPSTYRFNPDGTRLYVTTAATGKGVQKKNVRLDTLLIFDTSALPTLRLIQEVKVGIADCGRRPIAFLRQNTMVTSVFVPNPTDGTVSVLDGTDHSLIETVEIGDRGIHDFNFSFWKSGKIYGC